MASLTVRLSDFDARLLEELAKETGESKAALVARGLRVLSGMIREDDRTTRLSAQEFDDFLAQLEKGEKDSRILAARERLMRFKPVWEE